MRKDFMKQLSMRMQRSLPLFLRLQRDEPLRCAASSFGLRLQKLQLQLLLQHRTR